MVDELAQLQRATLDDPEEPWRKREEELVRKHDVQSLLKKQEAADKEEQAELGMLRNVWLEAQRQHTQRLNRQRMKVDLIQSDQSALEALNRELAKLREQARVNLDGLHTEQVTKCGSIADLRKEKAASLDQLHSGAWHSVCGRTASEILAATGQTLETHLGKAGGRMVPAPPERIAQKAREYDERIAKQTQQCDVAAEAIGMAKTKWIEKVRALEAKRPLVEEAKQASIQKARDDLALLEEQGRKANATQVARVDAVIARYRERREQLKLELEETRQQLNQAKAALVQEREQMEVDRRLRVAKLMDRIGRLRNELVVNAVRIRNAHELGFGLKVKITARFK